MPAKDKGRKKQDRQGEAQIMTQISPNLRQMERQLQSKAWLLKKARVGQNWLGHSPSTILSYWLEAA